MNAAPALARSAGLDTTPRFLIEVGAKAGTPDAAGAGVLAQLPTLGIAGAREVRVNALYEVRGRLTANQVTQIAKDLLCDPVTQEYRLDRASSPVLAPLGPHWRLEVWLKASMTDPTGESVRKGVKDLGLPEPTVVRSGTAYQIFGKLQKSQADRVLERLLANPVIHRTLAEPR